MPGGRVVGLIAIERGRVVGLIAIERGLDARHRFGKSRSMTFDHVAQVVPEISEAVRWYREHFPLAEVLYEDASWAFLDVNGTRLAFVLQDAHPGHLAWRVDDAELEALALRHEKTIIPHRDHTRSFYLLAPGGQHIELISYPPSADTRVRPKGP